jgi:hypothetical protein
MAWIEIDPACHGASVPIVHPSVVGVVAEEATKGENAEDAIVLGVGLLLTHCKKSNGNRSYSDTLYAVPDEVF